MHYFLCSKLISGLAFFLIRGALNLIYSRVSAYGADALNISASIEQPTFQYEFVFLWYADIQHVKSTSLGGSKLASQIEEFHRGVYELSWAK